MPYWDKAKQSRYQAERQKRLRRAWIQSHGPCQHCGSTHQLQVDHIDPARKVSHRIWSWSEDRRNAELAKCQVLCRTCNNKKRPAPPRPAATR